MAANVLIGAMFWFAAASSPEIVPRVTVQGRQAGAELRDTDPQVCHRFGGRPVELVLNVQGIAGARLYLGGRLLQRTSTLEAPVGEPFDIAADLSLDESARRAVTASIGLPAVKRATSFRVEFLARDNPAATWQPAGDLLLMVYPSELLDELRSYAESHTIAINDPGGTLASLFAAHKITYVETNRLREGPTDITGGSDQGPGVSPRLPNVALLVTAKKGNDDIASRRSSDNADTLLSKGYRVVRFLENVETLPLIRINDVGGSKRLDVEMRLLDSLMDDPRSQVLFLDIIRLAVNDDKP